MVNKISAQEGHGGDCLSSQIDTEIVADTIMVNLVRPCIKKTISKSAKSVDVRGPLHD